MCMAFPFLKLDEVEETWEFMKAEDLPEFSNDLDSKLFEKFISYLDDTWFKENSMFNKTYGTCMMIYQLEQTTLVRRLITS